MFSSFARAKHIFTQHASVNQALCFLLANVLALTHRAVWLRVERPWLCWPARFILRIRFAAANLECAVTSVRPLGRQCFQMNFMGSSPSERWSYDYGFHWDLQIYLFWASFTLSTRLRGCRVGEAGSQSWSDSPGGTRSTRISFDSQISESDANPAVFKPPDQPSQILSRYSRLDWVALKDHSGRTKHRLAEREKATGEGKLERERVKRASRLEGFTMRVAPMKSTDCFNVSSVFLFCFILFVCSLARSDLCAHRPL